MKKKYKKINNISVTENLASFIEDELLKGTDINLSSQNVLWVSPESLSDFPFPAANTKIISELHKYLEFLRG